MKFANILNHVLPVVVITSDLGLFARSPPYKVVYIHAYLFKFLSKHSHL